MPSSDRLLFQVQGLSAHLRVVRFEGREELGGPFAFVVTLVSEDPAIAFDSVVGQKALLTLQQEDGTPRSVHGVVAELELGEISKKLTSYRATLVPSVHHLGLGQEIRIFQELTAPEIITHVLEGAGVSSGDGFRLSLQGTYDKREYCVQYRESNWAFCRRLAEEEGIYIAFEHSEDKDVLVFADRSTAAPPIEGNATIVFREPVGALSSGEHVSRFGYSESTQPGKVTLRDFAFQKPSLGLEAGATAKTNQAIEVYDYPGDYEIPASGARLAKVRLEALVTPAARGAGESACSRLVPGATFTLAEHPRDALNQKWLVTYVEHRGFEPSVGEVSETDEARYENRFRVIPAQVPFRPPRVVPKPSIHGVQTAIVVGPAGEEIHTDAHGRVKVQFHWDRLGKKDDKSSCFIRVAQAWAGAAYGSIFIPRVGHEVVVDFLEGDPDRPLIVGRVYHGQNVPPYGLPAEKTKSTVKTSSSPGGGGSNELRFEDKAGSEEIFLHGQKDWTIAIENDKNQDVGHDETLRVGNNRTKTVGKTETESIGANKSITVEENHTEKIGKAEKVTVGTDATRSVGGDSKVTIGKSSTTEIGEARKVAVGKDDTLTVAGKQSVGVTGEQNESFGANRTTDVKGVFTLTVQKDLSTEVGGDHSEKAGKKRTMVVGEKLTVECGSAKVTIAKNGDITVDGKNVTIKGSGPVKIEGSKIDVKSQGAVNIEASGAVKIKGSTVGVN